MTSWSAGAENDSYGCPVVSAGSGTPGMSDSTKSEPPVVSECSVLEMCEPSEFIESSVVSVVSAVSDRAAAASSAGACPYLQIEQYGRGSGHKVPRMIGYEAQAEQKFLSQSEHPGQKGSCQAAL